METNSLNSEEQQVYDALNKVIGRFGFIDLDFRDATSKLEGCDLAAVAKALTSELNLIKNNNA